MSCGNCNSCNSGCQPNPVPRVRSQVLTGSKEDGTWEARTPARSMMRGVGFSDQDFVKPLVAVAAPYTNITPCNGHIRDLADVIEQECAEIGLKSYSFGTPVVTDGEAMGMSGMRYSLPSRDLIADCIEMMTEAYQCDGIIALSGCDKTIPASLMPLARNNLIGITLYGGSIRPGYLNGEQLDIVSPFEAVGKYSKGQIDKEELIQIEKNSVPSCGACGGMYTANTMSSAIEALGMSLPGSSSNPATSSLGRISDQKYSDALRVAQALKNLIAKQIKTRDILTKKAFENAITLMMALGGSTNGVLHLLAIAREAEVELSLLDFERIAKKTPLIADMKPSGKYLMFNLWEVGGVPMVLKHLYKAGLIHGDCLTVTGKTMAENLESAPDYKSNDVVYPVDKPVATAGRHIVVLHGNLAPEGAIAKLSGKYYNEEAKTYIAKVFDSEEEAQKAIIEGQIIAGDCVVIRHEGPKGGPGMREMLSPTSAIVGRGLSKDVALITDGRFSGGSHGIIIGHITPEAVNKGPIAIVENGDKIEISPATGELNILLEDSIITERLNKYKLPEKKYKKGVLAGYQSRVQSASLGAVLG